MLVLSRQRSEKVVITTADGTKIIVQVIDIRGDKVRLGFDAPDGVSVHRAEVQQRIDSGEGTVRK